MKRITIYQENSKPLNILDNDERSIEELQKDLQQLFKVDRVVSLKTSNGNYLIRPHKVTSIEICEDNTTESKVTEGDYITDAD